MLKFLYNRIKKSFIYRMKGGKGSKMMKGLKDPNLLREIVKVADDAIPVAEKAGNA